MRILVLIAALALAGCAPLERLPPGDAGRPGAVPDPAPVEERTPAWSATTEPGAAAAGDAPSVQGRPQAGAAVVALLDQARAEGAAGRGERAAALLERAIRIEPANPWLWHRLAVLRLQQGRWSEAAALAGRSNALAGDHARLLGGNWRVIAEARAGAGDVAGAAAARRRSASYFGRGGAARP